MGRFLGSPLPLGRFWNTIAIDRSQAAGLAFNLATIAQGGAANAAGWLNRWGAKQGAGAESAQMVPPLGFAAVLVNVHGGDSYRVLHFAIPLQHGAGANLIHNQDPQEDTWVFDAILGGSAGDSDTGVFFIQSDGTDAPGLIGAGGSRGFGFVLQGGACSFISSVGGVLLVSPTLQNLYRCQLTITNARPGFDAAVTVAIDGLGIAGTIPRLLGLNSYAAGRQSYVPVFSGHGGGSLFVGAMTLGVGPAGAV